jgi:hypothetical protein
MVLGLRLTESQGYEVAESELNTTLQDFKDKYQEGSEVIE